MEPIKVTFWNCRSINNKRMEILHLSSNTDILISVETWLKPQDRFEIPGFNSVRKDTWGNRGGGIIIFVAKHLKFKTLDNMVNGDLHVESCCIQIYNLTETINIATCYRPPGRKLSGDGWDKFLRAMTRLGSTLFLGDVNAHHVDWNCDHTDANGDILMDLIDKYQLDILNHNTKTYIDVRNNTSNNLDLALTSTRLTGISTVYQGEDPMGSDHFPLHIEVYVGKYVYKKTNNRLSSQRTDWAEYKDIMDSHYEYFIQNLVGPPLEKYKLFTDKMTQSIGACTPKKVEVPPGNHRNPVRWWDSECNKFVRLRKAAFKKWQHHPIYDNWISYRMSTPTNVVFAEAGVPFLQDRATFLGKTYLLKIFSNRMHLTNSCVKEFAREVNTIAGKSCSSRPQIFSECVKDAMRVEDLCYRDDNYTCLNDEYKALMTEVECDTDMGHRIQLSQDPNLNFNRLVREHYRYFTCIFTDGSKTIEGLSTGGAVVCLERAYCHPLNMNPEASVFTAECAALYKGLDFALSNCETSYLFCTDSLSAVMSPKSTKANVKTNIYILEIKNKVLQFREQSPNGSRVVFAWIPSHCGISGNERADIVAKEATSMDYSDEYKVPYTDFKEGFKKKMWEESEERLRVQFLSKEVLYYEHYFESSKSPWFDGRNLSRDFIVRFGRIRSNHHNCEKSLARLGIVQSSACQCLHPSRDIDHILWHCPLLSNERMEMLNKLEKANWRPPYSIQKIVSSMNIMVLNIINNFCDTNNIRF